MYIIKSFIYILLIQTKKNKQNKTVVKIHCKSSSMLDGVTANHVKFMQPMLISYLSFYFSSLEGAIRT